MDENPYEAPKDDPDNERPSSVPRKGKRRWGILVGAAVVIVLNLAAHVAYHGFVTNTMQNTILVVGIAAALAYSYWAGELTGKR